MSSCHITRSARLQLLQALQPAGDRAAAESES